MPTSNWMGEQATKSDANDDIPVPIPEAKAAAQGWVLDETIEDVDKSTNELIFKKHGKAAWAIILACAAWWGLMWYFMVTGGPFVKDDPREFGLMVPVFVLIGAYSVFKNKVLREFMQQFALANKMTYSQKGDASSLTGALFNLGHSHSMTNVVSGSFTDNNLSLFDYQYTIGSGKNSHTYACTATQIDYPSVLAPVLLTVDYQSFGGIVPFFGAWEKIKPEGNFDKNFDLYTKKEFEIEALQIFSPDFMVKMLGSWPEFNLEFNGNKIIVFYNRIITTKTELQKMFDLIKYLIVRIEPLAQRMESSVKDLEELQNSKQ